MEGLGAKRLWLIWGIATAIVSGVLFAALTLKHTRQHPVLAQVRSMFAPGQMTSGHHQIELSCESCHTNPLGGPEILQEACVRCHGAALKEADDKHPLSKFTDPRNADLLSRLDARRCVTCHVEHRPQVTLAMGVTQQADFCWQCHRDIAQERPSHRDLPFDTCASSGCHKFHDNRALYEDFLLKHANEKAEHGRMRAAPTNFLEIAESLPNYPSKQYPLKKLSLAQIDSPKPLEATLKSDPKKRDVLQHWLASKHAENGVNCSGCHQPLQRPDASWTDKPNDSVCASCHSLQSDSFKSGKHGMRISEDLTPMTPSNALLKFKASAAHKQLGCISCHAPHEADVSFAAVQACLNCHDDDHSKNYEFSKHAELWRRESLKQASPGTGVSCASCHMPRVDHAYEEYDLKQVYVQHNQSDTLRPREKMIRPVCMNCHGLGFSIDALADAKLIERNFNGQPSAHVRSIDMALAHDRAKDLEKKTTKK